MFITTSYIKRKIRGLSLRIFNTIENNGNTKFEKNGEKIFIDNLFDFFSKEGGEKKTIFDIGANIGEYSKMIEEKAIKLNVNINLHLFEPTQSCFSILLNKFNAENITINNFGISNENGVATIFYDKKQSGLASLYRRNLDSYDLKLDQKEEIKLRRLSDYIEEENILHIHFIKIDIEGHELKAFEGVESYLNGSFIDFIQFEYGGANLDSHSCLMDIYKFLNNRGFTVAKVMPKGLEIKQYAPYMDNFQYSNYVAISDKVIKNW